MTYSKKKQNVGPNARAASPGQMSILCPNGDGGGKLSLTHTQAAHACVRAGMGWVEGAAAGGPRPTPAFGQSWPFSARPPHTTHAYWSAADTPMSLSVCVQLAQRDADTLAQKFVHAFLLFVGWGWLWWMCCVFGLCKWGFLCDVEVFGEFFFVECGCCWIGVFWN